MIDVSGFENVSSRNLHGLVVVADSEGFESVFDLIEAYAIDSVVPTFCPNCNGSGDDAEPDQSAGYCSGCGKTNAVSILILAEII